MPGVLGMSSRFRRSVRICLISALGVLGAALPADAFQLRGTGVILIHGKAGAACAKVGRPQYQPRRASDPSISP